jgi:hypothetical protein
MSDPFESYIEAQLQLHLRPLVSTAKAPLVGRFAAMAVGAGVSAAAGPSVLAALTSKTAAGIVVVTLAAGGGGAVAATFATGSPDPAVWTRDARDIASGTPVQPAAGVPAVVARPAQPAASTAASSTAAPEHQKQATAAPAAAATATAKGNGNGGADNTSNPGRHRGTDDNPLGPPHKPLR